MIDGFWSEYIQMGTISFSHRIQFTRNDERERERERIARALSSSLMRSDLNRMEKKKKLHMPSLYTRHP
jgi:hypothetical protein